MPCSSTTALPFLAPSQKNPPNQQIHSQWTQIKLDTQPRERVRRLRVEEAGVDEPATQRTLTNHFHDELGLRTYMKENAGREQRGYCRQGDRAESGDAAL